MSRLQLMGKSCYLVRLGWGKSSSVAWGIRIQPTFALVRVVRGD